MINCPHSFRQSRAPTLKPILIDRTLHQRRDDAPILLDVQRARLETPIQKPFASLVHKLGKRHGLGLCEMRWLDVLDEHFSERDGGDLPPGRRDLFGDKPAQKGKIVYPLRLGVVTWEFRVIYTCQYTLLLSFKRRLTYRGRPKPPSGHHQGSEDPSKGRHCPVTQVSVKKQS